MSAEGDAGVATAVAERDRRIDRRVGLDEAQSASTIGMTAPPRSPAERELTALRARSPTELRETGNRPIAFLRRFDGDREAGGYPFDFHTWPLDRRNAWFAGFNVGFHDRLRLAQEEKASMAENGLSRRRRRCRQGSGGGAAAPPCQGQWFAPPRA